MEPPLHKEFQQIAVDGQIMMVKMVIHYDCLEEDKGGMLYAHGAMF